MSTCLYCNVELGEDLEAPASNDNAAWLALASDHAPGCAWIETRAHQLETPPRVVLNSSRDLRQWVWDHIGYGVTDADVSAVLSWIATDDHPAWGEDWAAYLDSLPDPLCKLIFVTP